MNEDAYIPYILQIKSRQITVIAHLKQEKKIVRQYGRSERRDFVQGSWTENVRRLESSNLQFYSTSMAANYTQGNLKSSHHKVSKVL